MNENQEVCNKISVMGGPACKRLTSSSEEDVEENSSSSIDSSHFLAGKAQFPTNRPNRECVLQRLSEALLRRSLTKVCS